MEAFSPLDKGPSKHLINKQGRIARQTYANQVIAGASRLKGLICLIFPGLSSSSLVIAEKSGFVPGKCKPRAIIKNVLN